MTHSFHNLNRHFVLDNNCANLTNISQDAETQRTLEMRHRMEEDDLYRQFAKKRVEEENVIQHQIRVTSSVLVEYFILYIFYET